MTRLQVGEFATLEQATKELNRLRAAKLDCFYLKEADRKFHVYVGSYADEKRAEQERRRISALGVKITMRKVMVAVPTFLLTAGYFPSKVAALAKSLELEKQGVKSEVVERSAQPEQVGVPLEGDEENHP